MVFRQDIKRFKGAILDTHKSNLKEIDGCTKDRPCHLCKIFQEEKHFPGGQKPYIKYLLENMNN